MKIKNITSLGQMFFLLIAFVLSNSALAQETPVEIYPNLKSQKDLKLCATFTNSVFRREDPDKFLEELSGAIKTYGIDMINAHHFQSTDWLKYPNYEKIAAEPAQDKINQYRSYYKRIKDQGVYLIISGNEPSIPEDFFEKYPEMSSVINGKFWQFLEDKASELYQVLPEMDCYELFTWETPIVNDNRAFGNLNFSNYYTGFPYYSHSDYFKYMFDAYSAAANKEDKDFMLLSFSHYPFQEKVMIEALENRDKNYPFLLDHKCQPGDWVPFKPANNIMLTVTDMPAILQFDGTGEYWGQSLAPYCFPEEIQARVQHALTANQNIYGLNMRINWAHGSLFGRPNEINFYALSKLAEDPFTPIKQIWEGWASERFGEKAADKVVSALKRTDDIGKLIFYIDGMWVFNHSSLAPLDYLESHVINYGKAMARMQPGEIMGNYRLNEILNYPREYLIQGVLEDRDEALRLNALSLQDIEETKKDLKPEDYLLLKTQLQHQRDMARASKLHLEAFLRYRIEKQNPQERGLENRKRLEACLQQMEKMSKEMEGKNYKDDFPFLRPSLFTDYVKQVRVAVAEL